MSSIVNQCLHHDAMCTQQVFFFEWVEVWELLVSGNGIFHLLYLAQRSHDRLTVHNVAHLIFVEGVTFNGK